MSTFKSPEPVRQAGGPSPKVELGLVQVDVAYSRKACPERPERDLHSVREIVGNSFHAIAELRGGKLYSWDDDGGAFLFSLEGESGFDNCCLAAIQMLEMVPSINQDVQISTGIILPMEVRLVCDAGTVRYDGDPASVTGSFIDDLMKHRRQVGVGNSVTITDRVYRRLTRPFKSRFVSWKYSAELGVELHRTPVLKGGAWSDARPADEPPTRVDGEQPAAVKGVAGPAGTAGSRVGQWLRRLRADRSWQRAAAVLAAVFLAGLLVGRVALPRHSPAAPAPAPERPAITAAAAAPAAEPARPDEWTTWREALRDSLSRGPVTEAALADAIRNRPAASASSPAALLREHQAVARELLSYEGAGTLLWNRFGIDEHFLGTGLSKPVSAADYWSASVHEYLIENLPDNHPQVWMLKIKALNLDLERTVKDLITKAPNLDGEKQGLKEAIIARATGTEQPSSPPVVIRFARLDERLYSRRLGKPERARVFASDLAEVWNLKVREAADRSGYTYAGAGDTFFVWVFVPYHRDEVVSASWGEVFSHLPAWLKAVETRAP